MAQLLINSLQAGEGHQVDCQFAQVSVKLAGEAQAAGDACSNNGNMSAIHIDDQAANHLMHVGEAGQGSQVHPRQPEPGAITQLTAPTGHDGGD